MSWTTKHESQALQSGVAAQLSKPLKRTALFNLLAKTLQRASAASRPRGAVAGGALALDRQVPTNKSLRILVAEDNPVNTTLVLALLKRLGYQADAVSSGLEAVSALRTRPYDVILMDVQMPVMDGLEATRTIRRESSSERRVRIVALTAGVTPDELRSCHDAGMDEILMKPLQSQQLAATLAACELVAGSYA